MFSVAVCLAVVAASPQFDRAINDPEVPRGVLIDFFGPPEKVPYRMTRFEITFAGTDERFVDDSVGNSYDPHDRQVSLWAECQRLRYVFRVVGNTRVLVEGCVIDGIFHEAVGVRFQFEAVPPKRYPRVFLPKVA